MFLVDTIHPINKEIQMPENEKTEGFYQEQYRPLLNQIARTLGTLAADNDEAGMNWFVDHVAILVQEATERMVAAQIDQDGGSPLPH